MGSSGMVDFKCNLNCPQKTQPPPCCRLCSKARKDFIDESNKKFWTDSRGFWSENGCKLERDKMPEECKSYDCRMYQFVTISVWSGQGWLQNVKAVPQGKRVEYKMADV